MTMETAGVVYWLCGSRAHEVFEHSIASLAAVSDLPVCILCAIGSDSEDYAWDFAASNKWPVTNCIRVPLMQFKRHRHYVTKATLPTWSPFDRTLFLDADTWVQQDPQPLLDALDDAPLVVTQFSDWITTGKIISGRLRSLERALASENYAETLDARAPGWREQLAEPHPAINTGVMAWRKRWNYGPWLDVTLAGWEANFTDEIALQALLPVFGQRVKIMPEKWNRSAKFGRTPEDQTGIFHFHGRSQYRHAAPKALWDRLVGAPCE